MSVHAARSRVTQARENLAAGRLDLVESALRTAEQYLAGLADDEVPALLAEIAAVRVELANLPTEEETRAINAARGKLRAARSRLEERNFFGIDDTLASATKYLAPVRPERRAAVDTEITSMRAEIEAARAGDSSVAPVAAPSVAPTASAASSGPTDEEARGISAARGKLRAARSRIAEDQLLGIDDVITAASNYLAPVRPEHRAAVDAEIAVVRAEIEAARPKPIFAPPPPPAPYAPPPPAPYGSPPPPYASAPYAPPPPAPYAPPPPAPYAPPPPAPYAPPPPAPPPPPAGFATVSVPAPSPAPAAAAAAASPPSSAVASSDARSMIRLGRRKLADGQLPGIGDLILTAAKHLEHVNAEQRHAIEIDLAALRAEVMALPGGPAVLGPAVLSLRLAAGPPPPPTRSLTEDQQANVSRARGRVIAARSAIESRRLDAVEPALDEAAALLEHAPEAAGAELRREIEFIRGQLVEELRAQARRRVMEDIERHLRRAEDDADYQHIGTAQEAVQRALSRVAEPDVAGLLTAAQIADYRKRAAALQAALATVLRRDAFERAKAPLEELERDTAVDVFAGMAGHDVLRKDRDLAYARARVLGAIRNAPTDDPEIAKLIHRLVTVDRKISASLTTWSTWRREELVTNDWAAISRETSGWTQEALSTGEDPAQLDEPELPLTQLALRRARLLFGYNPRRAATEPDGRPTGGEDATATLDPRDLTEHMFTAASTKLAAAYIRLLDAAEKQPSPLDPFLLRRPAQIAYTAALTLAGTPHREAIVARAEALDDRWRAAYVAATIDTFELYDKLAREAERKWPELRDSSNALPFDTDRTQPGTLLFLEGALNRCGWDYQARGVELATRIESALVAGSCAPHVKAALQHALRVQRLDISDRVPWNAIGLVRSVGTIDVRTQLTLRDQATGRVIDHDHAWSPQPCVYLQIVGLQVGPVIVFDHAAVTSYSP